MYLLEYKEKSIELEDMDDQIKLFQDCEEMASFVAEKSVYHDSFEVMGLYECINVSNEEYLKFATMVSDLESETRNQQGLKYIINQSCVEADKIKNNIDIKKNELNKFLTEFTEICRNKRIKEIEDLESKYWKLVETIQEKYNLLNPQNRYRTKEGIYGNRTSKYLDLKIPE